MFDGLKKHKEALKVIGAILVTGLVIYAWVSGFFGFIFYLFGFYVVLYFVSRLFKTTAILGFIVGAGGVLLYLISGLWFLYAVYSALKVMFETNFFIGLLLLFIGLPISQWLIYAAAFCVGAILGVPLFWMIEDLEKRIQKPIIVRELGAAENLGGDSPTSS